jgi:hypothetical protein
MSVMTETEELAKEYFENGRYYESFIKYVELCLMKGISAAQLNTLFKTSELEFVKNGLIEAFLKMKRIISYGNEWNEDEWLLLLTIRVEIQLVLEFFSKPKEVNQIDEIDHFLRHSKDDKNYIHAKKLILRNWKSIDRKWLSTFIS